MFGLASKIIVLLAAIAAGMGYFSFWWTLLPIFLAGSFSLSNGPHLSNILDANRQGRLGVFPMLLAMSMLPWLFVGGVAFWITSALVST